MDYACELDRTEFRDMKKYNPNFNEDSIKGLDDEAVRTIFKEYYSSNLPVDLLTWMRVFEPKNGMHYKKGYWDQTVFIRDEINALLYPDYDICHANPVMVIATHISKSIIVPIYYMNIAEYGTEIIMKYNFMNWIISINSKHDITGIDNFFTEDEPVRKVCCENMRDEHIYGMYKDNNKQFTIDFKGSKYELWTMFYLMMTNLRNKK